MTDSRDQTLLRLMREDQAEDRAVVAGSDAYQALRSRDGARREAVMEVLAAGWPDAPDTLYAAAWILNHGDTPEEAFLGHRLAARARDLGHGPSRWLAAAALDRSLMYAGRPQKFGTNIVPDGVGWRLWDVDPSTTDDERRDNNVPTLAEMQARAAADTTPQPLLEAAPDWLKRMRRD